MTDITTTSTTTTSPTPSTVIGTGEVISPALPAPGWRTSEFWLKLAALALTVLYASGALTNSTALAIAGMAAAILGALGYTVSRTMVKTAASAAPVTIMSTPKFTTRGSLVALLVVSLGLSMQPACGTPAVVTGGAVVIDCLAQDQTQLMELVGSLWAVFTSSGSWKDVESQAITAGKDLGGCALAEVVQHYLAPPKGRAAPAGEQGRAARAALEDFRATQANGATFKTAAGNL
jgi:hypothetical protein